MARFIRFGLTGMLFVSLLIGATSAHAAGGGLDPSFGNGGKVLTPVDANVVAHDAVLQPNGDIVVALETSFSLGAVRYLPNGHLDTSFGNGGIAQGPSNNYNNLANALTIQSDGKIVVAGETTSMTGQVDAFAAARFNANGSLDTGFGSSGQVTVQFATSTPSLQTADAGLVQPDGKILLGGQVLQATYRSSTSFTAVVRLNANGSLDTSFGSGGEVLANRIGNVVTMGLDATGDIFLLNHGAIAELSPVGTFDANVTPAPITAGSHGGVDAFQSSGQYVTANTIGVTRHDTDVQVQRLTPTGSADPSFTSPPLDFTGQDGQASDSPTAVAIQPNGQIVAAGSHFFGTAEFGVARVNANGSLDAGFGNGGVLTTSFFGNEGVTALLIQPDGKILAIGYTQNNSTGQIYLALVRYLGS